MMGAVVEVVVAVAAAVLPPRDRVELLPLIDDNGMLEATAVSPTTTAVELVVMLLLPSSCSSASIRCTWKISMVVDTTFANVGNVGRVKRKETKKSYEKANIVDKRRDIDPELQALECMFRTKTLLPSKELQTQWRVGASTKK